MKWSRGGRSGHIRDQRSSGGGGFGGGFGGFGFPSGRRRGGGFGFPGGGFGGGGLGFPMGRRRGGAGMGVGCPMGCAGGLGLPMILFLLMFMFLGRGCFAGGGGFDFGEVFTDLPQVGAPVGGSGDAVPGAPDPEAELVDFVSFVLDDVQTTWSQQFQEGGESYAPADLVLFTNATSSGCGSASSATGPFYCPADETVYLDLDFFRELRDRFQAPGDFAQAYVIAHEIAHHVQNLTGISDEVHSRQQDDRDEANELSVRLELQADCLAGIWAHSTYERGILETGDLEEGLTAAAAIGDDRIQSESTGQVNPETWTHGSSEQRTRWLRTGFESGDPSACDTFSAEQL